MVPWVRTSAPEGFGAAEAARATFGQCSNVSESIVMVSRAKGPGETGRAGWRVQLFVFVVFAYSSAGVEDRCGSNLKVGRRH